LLYRILFGQKLATFATCLPLDIAVAQLSDLVRGEFFGSAPAGNAVIGTISPHKVALRYSRHPITRNSFAPYFIGRFEVTGQGLELKGAFRSSQIVRIIMISALGFMAVWIAATTAFALRGPANLWLLPIVGTVLLFFVGGLPIVGRKLADGDEEMISKAITYALNSRKSS
jgi:hypothetical protein